MRRAVGLGLILVTIGAGAHAAKTTAADVLKHMEKCFAPVKNYRAEATARVDTPQLHIKDSRATIYFKRPNRVKVVARDGFSVIPSEAIPGDQAAWIRDNFDAAYVGIATREGIKTHVLKLVGKTPNAPAAVKMWIDKSRGVILATESSTDGLTMKSRWTYKKVDGKCWLPTEIKIDMSGIASPGVSDPHKAKQTPPKSGNGTAVVKITKYVINKGVPESVFKNANK